MFHLRPIAFLLVSVGLSAVAARADEARPGIRWEPLGEPGCGGWLTAISISPNDPRRVLLGGDMLGIGVSDDRGGAWRATTGLKSWEIADFTWHPTDPNVVWVGTMSGPYLSADAGRTWTEHREGMPAVAADHYSAPIQKVLFDPADARHLLAFGGSWRGWVSPGNPAWGAVWESADAGDTWTSYTRLGPGGAGAAEGRNVVSVGLLGGGGHRRIFAVVEGRLLIGDDFGRSWAVAPGAGLPAGASISNVAPHPSDPATLWAAVNNYVDPATKQRKPGGVYKSVDAGATWVDSSLGLSRKCDPANPNFTARYQTLAVSPAAPNVLYTSDTSWNAPAIYRSADGGASWSLVATKRNVGPDDNDPARFQIPTATPAGLGLTVMACDPKDAKVFFGGQSEVVVRTLDGGATWTDATSEKVGDGWRGRGFTGWCGTAICFDPFKQGRLIVQGMDACRVWQTFDGGTTWTYHAADPSPWEGGRDAGFAGDGTTYAAFGQGSFDGIGVSKDGGAHWRVVYGPEHGLPKLHGGGEPGGVVVHAERSTLAWVTIDGNLYQTSDGGERWAVMLSGLGLGSLAPDPADADRFYAAGAGGVYAIGAGGTHEPLGGPRPAATRGRIRCDARGNVYLAVNRKGRAGLWRYASGEWRRLLDDSCACDVAIDPSDPNRIALTTSDDPYHDYSGATGVWVSADAGATWSQANDGLAMLRGQAIAFDPFDPQALVVGTFGRGFFKGKWPKSFAPTGGRRYVHTPADAQAAAPPKP